LFSYASSGRLGKANGGGGAIFAKSVALTNFSVAESIFNGISVSVASGTTGLPSFSRRRIGRWVLKFFFFGHLILQVF
jgi:hypothetical protein